MNLFVTVCTTFLGLSILGTGVYAQGTASTAPPNFPAPFKSAVEATSYAVGVDMIRNFKAEDVSFDLNQLIEGISDAAKGSQQKMSDTDVKRLVAELEAAVRKKMVVARRVEAEANLKKSDEFMKTSAARPDVIKLPSGVQYKVVKMGTGPKANEDSTVIALYKGTLPDGTVFDASEPGKPLSIKVSQVIPGWKEALKLMPAGSKWEVTIPSNQAYGERGAGRVVGPNLALRFDIEVIEVR